MKVSVALCTYNGQKYIEEQMNSLLLQTRLPDEIVICDDFSTDGTFDIVSGFSKSSASITVYRNPANVGPTLNFERAIKLCSGDIIFLSDQDDIWMSDKIEVMLNEFKKDPDIGMVFGNAYVVDERLRTIGTLWEMLDFSQKEKEAFISGKAIDILAKRNFVTGMAMAVRRSALKDTFPFARLWVHDEWIAIIVACQSKVVLLNRTVVFYRQHSNQQIGIKRRSFFRKLRSRIKNNSIKRCRRRIEKLSIVIERLEQTKVYDPELLERLKDRIHHWEVRTSLPKNKFDRLWAIRQESYRYTRYENRLVALMDWIKG